MDGPEIDLLLQAALRARGHAYAPYSAYPVGAALLAADGRIFAGCNVENACYPVGACAETGAISAMVAAGSRRMAAMLIVAEGRSLVTPCGACRQRMVEFGDEDAMVHLARPSGVERSYRLGRLLPGAFGPEALPG